MQCAVFPFKIACIRTTGLEGEISRRNTNCGKFSNAEVIDDISKNSSKECLFVGYLFRSMFVMTVHLHSFISFWISRVVATDKPYIWIQRPVHSTSSPSVHTCIVSNSLAPHSTQSGLYRLSTPRGRRRPTREDLLHMSEKRTSLKLETHLKLMNLQKIQNKLNRGSTQNQEHASDL